LGRLRAVTALASPSACPQAFVSYPRPGKHLAFPGHLLHGAPRDLNTRWRSDGLPKRVTLLVNVWRTRGPTGVKPLPRAIAARLRPAGDARPCLEGSPSAAPAVEAENGRPACAPRLVVQLPRTCAAGVTALEEHVDGLTAPLPTSELWRVEGCAAESANEASGESLPSSCLVVYVDVADWRSVLAKG
jgi:hypothetical protein